MPLTFNQVRRQLIKILDDSHRRLRAVVSDREWNNELFGEFAQALAAYNEAINELKKLNNVEIEYFARLRRES